MKWRHIEICLFFYGQLYRYPIYTVWIYFFHTLFGASSRHENGLIFRMVVWGQTEDPFLYIPTHINFEPPVWSPASNTAPLCRHNVFIHYYYMFNERSLWGPSILSQIISCHENLKNTEKRRSWMFINHSHKICLRHHYVMTFKS